MPVWHVFFFLLLLVLWPVSKIHGGFSNLRAIFDIFLQFLVFLRGNFLARGITSTGRLRVVRFLVLLYISSPPIQQVKCFLGMIYLLLIVNSSGYHCFIWELILNFKTGCCDAFKAINGVSFTCIV